MAVVESFKEALIGRVGAERYQMWFANGVDYSIIAAGCRDAVADAVPQSVAEGDSVIAARALLRVRVRGQFALERLRTHFLREIRGAASQACGSLTDVQLCLDEPPAAQSELPLGEPGQLGQPCQPPAGGQGRQRGLTGGRRGAPSSRGQSRRGNSASLAQLMGEGAVRGRRGRDVSATSAPPQEQLRLPLPGSGPAVDRGAERPEADSDPARSSAGVPSTSYLESFVRGPSNQLAYTAMMMACQNPGAASPLFISGPTGTGKTHLLSAIAEQFRRRHRLRRVMHLSAEQFTNDFISSVGNSGITAFRRRYREVDALLIDDVQFLGSKKATLRELLYTVETLSSAGRPLVFSALQSPMEIQGLASELAGRMAAGLVCPIGPLDSATRQNLFRGWLRDRCPIEVPETMVVQLAEMLSGDGRVISGVVNIINTLQRMFDRMPTMDELRQFGGDLLRSARPVATLAMIEHAVCEAFHLAPETLRGVSQSRSVTQPRMLAMYLSRQLTSAAYAEIARHFGGKSHSTAISAEQNVKSWLASGKPIGRGSHSMSVKEALDRVEGLLRSG